MSLQGIVNTSLTGLRASQQGLKIASDNVANANTPGYARAEPQFTNTLIAGQGAGVEISGVRRAADRFLAQATYAALAAQGGAAARHDLVNRAQAAFGDPATNASLFAGLDRLFGALGELQLDPASPVRRANSINQIEAFYTDLATAAGEISGLILEADQRVAERISEAQDLINRIHALNGEIQQAKGVGADPTGPENAQAPLVDRLAELLDIRTVPNPAGGVEVRTAAGAHLVGVTPAGVSYTPADGPFGVRSGLELQRPTTLGLEAYVRDGEIRGLLDARDKDLPQLLELLGALSAETAATLNAVHNANVGSPPAAILTGRNTGLADADPLRFTGLARVGVTDANGVLTHRLTIDFTAGQITAEPAAGPYSFAAGTIGAFETALNAALTPAGASATFAGGVLTLSGGAGARLVVQDDATTPASRAGQGFSHFFGLNDLITRPTPISFATGVQAADPHGLVNGGGFTVRVTDASGRLLVDAALTVDSAGATGTTWQSLITQLNTAHPNLGQFGAFALDGEGRLAFQPQPGFKGEVVNDTALRADTGLTLSQLFGLNPSTTQGRALDVTVNPAVKADPARLAVGRPPLDTAALTDRIIESGDNRGARALITARDALRTFPAAGGLAAGVTSLTSFTQRVAGEAGRIAILAENTLRGAEARAAAAVDRRSSVEGVNLDDELIRMNQFQQSYAAAARVLQAAQDMYDILLSIGR